MIKDNLIKINNLIDEAQKNSRYGQEVTLIAVSKTKPASMVQEAYDCGIRDFGENKVQEICEKHDVLPSDIRWHMIGHLQTNKVKNVVDKVYMIHSVDSLHLAQEIENQAAKKGITVKILVQVNISHEETKSGVDETEIFDLVKQISAMPHIKIMGLMTIAPFTENPEDTRPVFAKLKKLSIDINNLKMDNVLMEYLSMGMSGDFRVAIEEGANFVRIGTAIFGERNYNI